MTQQTKTDHMKRQVNSALLFISVTILTSIHASHAKQSQPFSDFFAFHHSLNKIQQWLTSHRAQFHQTHFPITPPVIISAVLCFVAASLSSAGGVGGGGLFIPVLTIVAGVDLKTASSLSAFMVTGGSAANVLSNFCSMIGGKSTIDFDIALLTEPCMLLGVSIGVICNLALPEWLNTVLFAIFLAWSTIKTFRSGLLYWKLETEEQRNGECEKLEDGTDNKNGVESLQEPLLDAQEDHRLRFPWMKLGVLVVVWFSFYFIYLLRGNRYGQSIIPIETCGVSYWILSSLQFPVAVAFTLWILYQQKSSQPDSSTHNQKDTVEGPVVGPSNKLIFPSMALLAGILGGMFGIGGGMLISPFLLQMGIVPEVTAATCSFMVFFSSTMSACQYLLLGMERAGMAVVYAAICFVASVVGLVVVQKAIRKYGRASLIIFSVAIVMALSTVLMTTFGVLDVLRDYNAGEYMGFKSPC